MLRELGPDPVSKAKYMVTSHRRTSHHILSSTTGSHVTVHCLQLACEAEREWPLFVYSILATYGVAVVLAVLWTTLVSKSVVVVVVVVVTSGGRRRDRCGCCGRGRGRGLSGCCGGGGGAGSTLDCSSQ